MPSIKSCHRGAPLLPQPSPTIHPAKDGEITPVRPRSGGGLEMGGDVNCLFSFTGKTGGFYVTSLSFMARKIPFVNSKLYTF